MHIAEYILYFYCSFNDAASNSDHVMPDFLLHSKKLIVYDVGGSSLGPSAYSSPEFAWGPQKDYRSLSRERWSPFKNMNSRLDGNKAGVLYTRRPYWIKIAKKKKVSILYNFGGYLWRLSSSWGPR